MAKAIHPALLEQLRWLDGRADKLRRELGLHRRAEMITWYISETEPDRFFEVVADGYGEYVLFDYRGINPNDRQILHEEAYGNEEAACRAAWRLGECGALWAGRDIKLGDREGEDAAESL
jgi:hypothetical protein